MDRKELTSGEAEPLEYSYRVPFYSTMELFIETLTGTCFELRVSPFETVVSVKAKIQRLEGIPISQQYLIWHNIELEDEYCLHDYSITDGSTLKLVLAMRGGPINTRRIAMEEPSFREMADYVDANQEELFENLSAPPSAGNNGSNKQVTLLVYRDGDQLNFFRVVDRGDGTLTPLSESLSGGSLSNMEEEEDAEVSSQQKWTVSQVVENNITASKMKQLRSHMHNLSLKGGSNGNNKMPVSLDETPVVVSNETKKDQALKLSLVRRHLSFSPKDTCMSETQEISKLPPTLIPTSTTSSFVDLPASRILPKQPPPSAEETKSITVEKCTNSAEARLVSEKSPKIRVKSTPKMARKGTVLTTSLKSDSEISEGEITIHTDFQTPVHTASSLTPRSTSTITKAELLRARLNRIKQTMNTESIGDVTERVPPESATVDMTPKRQISETGKTSGEKLDPSTLLDNSGKRSPRTQRLLAALSNNGKMTSSQSAKKRLPVTTLPKFSSSLTQGMAFNRHEMYLRSYGLLPSPEEDGNDEAIRNLPVPIAETTVPKPRADDIGPMAAIKAPQSAKILETPHGVKYTTSGAGGSYYSRPWYDRSPRSPVPPHPGSHGVSHQSAVKDSSKTENPSSYSLFHPYNRELKPLKPPTMTPCHPKLGSIDNTALVQKHSLSGYGRPVSNWSSDRVKDTPTSGPNSSVHRWSGMIPNQEKVSDTECPTTHATRDSTNTVPAIHQPRPPSSSTTGVSTLRYHGRRQTFNSKTADKLHQGQAATTTTTSGVRMTDSPNGKIETMSRQEAREVVDFINKAMDVSILRSLVKSPGKEAHRGSSGQSGYRHAPVPYHHYGDSSRHTTETGPKYTASGTTRMGSKVEITPLGAPRIPMSSAHSRPSMRHSPPTNMNLLPPVKPAVTKKKRCFLCSKKTGLATSYICRCGNNFCATHRYAETHDCTYDYKTRGRKLLEESNPLVSAPKLPKI